MDGLNIGNGGVFVDVTFGGGGHSREIMSRLDANGHLYSFDQDADAEKNAEGFDAEKELQFLKPHLLFHLQILKTRILSG